MNADVPVMIPGSKVWLDRRLLEVDHNCFARELRAPSDLGEWHCLRKTAQDRVRLAAGLLPEPCRFHPRPRVYDRTVWHGVAISKVEIESRPGLRLTGNLFEPEHFSGPLPGILSPHGHWKDGRINHNERG